MRYSNKDLIQRFISGETIGDSHTGNLRIHGNKLVNYSTVIATRINSDQFLLNRRRYSVTTSKIQNMIAGTLAVHKFSRLPRPVESDLTVERWSRQSAGIDPFDDSAWKVTA